LARRIRPGAAAAAGNSDAQELRPGEKSGVEKLPNGEGRVGDIAVIKPAMDSPPPTA
jgi:hypothetical protein